MSAGKSRQRVDVMRPTANLDKFGKPQGNDPVIYPGVDCYVEPLSGRELVQARTVFATVTHRVRRLLLDPSKRITAKDYLMLDGRRLNIVFPNDLHQNGTVWECLCNEEL